MPSLLGAAGSVVGVARADGGFLDAPGFGDADALVNRECLPQVLPGLAGIAVLQVAVPESFQGERFL